MASYRRIEVKPIAGALGAEIANVDLSTLDDETFREIKAVWLKHLTAIHYPCCTGIGCQTYPRAWYHGLE